MAATRENRAFSYWRWEQYKENEAILREIKKMPEKDYYSILGVQRNCSSDDVKRAYFKLSLKVHPDKNDSPQATEVFKLVSNAYERLRVEKSSTSPNVTPRYRGWESVPTTSNFGGVRRKPAAAAEMPEFKCFGCGQNIYGGRTCRCRGGGRSAPVYGH